MLDSCASCRVISYRHNLARVNFDNPMGMQNIVGSYSGPFTQDMTHVTPSHNEAHFQRGIPNGVKLTHPWELRFHVLLSSLKLFVSRLIVPATICMILLIPCDAVLTMVISSNLMAQMACMKEF